MKTKLRFFIILATIFSLSLLPCGKLSYTHAATSQNADIVYAYLGTSITLYSQDAETLTYSPLTSLPQTYFVALLEEEDTEGEYIRIAYSDLIGYVKKADIEICDYEPVTKYAEAFLTMDSDYQPVNLRSSPDHTTDKNITVVIPHAQKVFYYGMLDGTPLHTQIGNTWYYVKYETDEDVYFGYVYSSQVSVQKINANVIEKIIKPTPEPEPSPNLDSTIKDNDNDNNTITTVIIICLTIPAVLVMLLLFQKPQSAKRKPRHG